MLWTLFAANTFVQVKVNFQEENIQVLITSESCVPDEMYH